MHKMLLICLALGGCAQTQPFLHTCPSTPVYPASFERAAAKQLAALPADSALSVMIEDYLAVRKEIKQCEAQ